MDDNHITAGSRAGELSSLRTQMPPYFSWSLPEEQPPPSFSPQVPEPAGYVKTYSEGCRLLRPISLMVVLKDRPMGAMRGGWRRCLSLVSVSGDGRERERASGWVMERGDDWERLASLCCAPWMMGWRVQLGPRPEGVRLERGRGGEEVWVGHSSVQLLSFSGRCRPTLCHCILLAQVNLCLSAALLLPTAVVLLSFVTWPFSIMFWITI